jgi:hypothetical protein
MKANELMVSDFVDAGYKYHNIDGSISPVYSKILNLSIDNEIVVSGENNMPSIVEEWRLKPIPLTKEIMDENNFQKIDGHTYSLGNDANCQPLYVSFYHDYEIQIITYYEDEYGTQEMYLGGFHYVHELQHLLKLLKIEKKIEL